MPDTKTLEEEDREKSPSVANYPYDSHPPSGPQHSYGKGGVGLTQRRLTARHVTFIGFGGGIGTGLFIGTGSALASAGPAGLLLAYVVVGGILWCVMECLGEMATYVSIREKMLDGSLTLYRYHKPVHSLIMLLVSSTPLWVSHLLFPMDTAIPLPLLQKYLRPQS